MGESSFQLSHVHISSQCAGVAIIGCLKNQLNILGSFANISGSLYGNRTLRDLGLTSLGRQDKGVTDLIGLLQGVSGAAAPTYGQAQEQENAIEKYQLYSFEADLYLAIQDVYHKRLHFQQLILLMP